MIIKVMNNANRIRNMSDEETRFKKMNDIKNIQISRVFDLSKSKPTDDMTWLIYENYNNVNVTIGTMTRTNDKSYIFSVSDEYKEVYSSDDLEDIAIKKLSEHRNKMNVNRSDKL